MENDKLFAAYALVLIAAVASVITASLVSGVATLPPPLGFLEHLALGIAMRAAYKSFGGFDWSDWSVTSDAAATTDSVSSSSVAVDATS